MLLGFFDAVNFKLVSALIVFSYKLMGTLNLLSEVWVGQPLLAMMCLNLMI